MLNGFYAKRIARVCKHAPYIILSTPRPKFLNIDHESELHQYAERLARIFMFYRLVKPTLGITREHPHVNTELFVYLKIQNIFTMIRYHGSGVRHTNLINTSFKTAIILFFMTHQNYQNEHCHMLAASLVF